jgi:hypothetical protein
MKKLLTISVAVLIACSSMVSMAQTKAPEQTNVITLAPFGFINKARVKYECKVTDYISLGVFANYYYATFKGFRADPFIRIYLANKTKAPEGFYLQAKASIGSFSGNIN